VDSSNPWPTVLEYAGKLTIVSALCVFIVALLTGKLRLPRELANLERQLDDMTRDRDEWKRAALTGAVTTKYAVRAVDQTTRGTENGGAEEPYGQGNIQGGTTREREDERARQKRTTRRPPPPA
jgi:hypothetical protein